MGSRIVSALRALLPGIACALLAGAVAGAAVAQEPDPQLPISLDADSADLDRKSSMVTYRGLKLTQGNIGVQADLGRATNLDFEDSVWHFSGNVVIDAPQGRVECESADIRFQAHQLQTARITGSPATFELRRPDTEAMTHAQARNLVYDFSAGVVEFSGDAVITEGGNRISSDYLVYNIAEQRIQATSGEGRVRIKYTPAGAADDASEAGGEEDAERQRDEPPHEPDGP